MGITFGKDQLERGHPLTVFLNDKGVLIGSKANSAKFADHQKALGELMSKGATVLIVPKMVQTPIFRWVNFSLIAPAMRVA